MSLRTVIWLVLIGSSILILIEYLYRKNKAGKMQKEAIRARWGKPPKVTDYDKEESLKKAYISESLLIILIVKLMISHGMI
ncbi:hypothetical protein [Enterococcus sp.]|uniref:hypothetical protein n=1 Tax=Enterococcus sp. TaxID=35783 RepID=UPI0028A952BF|nr:hypothetical protein [Enterococcus sp.]